MVIKSIIKQLNSKELNQDLQDGHEHIKTYNEDGYVNSEDVKPLPHGYNNLTNSLSGGGSR